MSNQRDAQKAAYVALLVDLARAAEPRSLPGYCDRIERTLKSLAGAPQTTCRRGRIHAIRRSLL